MREPPSAEPRGRRGRLLGLWTAAAIVYLVAGVLLSLPAFAFVYGIQDLGDELGWWQGDPNANDDDYLLALPFAVVSYAIVLPLAGVVMRVIDRRHRLGVAPQVWVGSCLSLSMVIVIGLVLFWGGV